MSTSVRARAKSIAAPRSTLEAGRPQRPPEPDRLAEQAPAVDLGRPTGPGRWRDPRALVHRLAAQPRAATSARYARAPSPRTWRMSSSYLRTTPSVSSTSSGVSSRAPSDEQRGRPVERLGDARHLRQVGLAQAVDEADDLAGELLGRGRDARQDDLELLLGGRVVDPVVQAAPLERVVDLARPVRGEDHARRPLGLDRADLGDRHLEVGQDLEQVRLELLVGAVDLVDEQDRRDAVGRLERLEERAADQEVAAEDVVGARLLRLAARLQQPDLEHLARVVPLVDRGVDVEALVALEADEPGAEARGEDLGELRLADAGLALEEQRPAELQRQEDRRRERPVGDVVAAAEVVRSVPRWSGCLPGGSRGRTGSDGRSRCGLLHGRSAVAGRRPRRRPRRGGRRSPHDRTGGQTRGRGPRVRAPPSVRSPGDRNGGRRSARAMRGRFGRPFGHPVARAPVGRSAGPRVRRPTDRGRDRGPPVGPASAVRGVQLPGIGREAEALVAGEDAAVAELGDGLLRRRLAD